MSFLEVKTDELNVPSERCRSPTPEFPMPYDELRYIIKNTDFADEVIFYWYDLIKKKSTGNEVGITLDRTTSLINSVYGDTNLSILNGMWNFSDGGLFYLKFKHFMTAISQLSDADNLEDLRLDLTALMCCDIHGKKGKVNRKKLAAVLKEAGQLAHRQVVRLQNDIDDIFHTMKDHVSSDSKMDVAYFRYGIQISDKDITDQITRDGKYHVTTCIPEPRTAILAIANYAVYPGSLKLSSRKLGKLPTVIIRSKESQSAAAELGQAAAASGSR